MPDGAASAISGLFRLAITAGTPSSVLLHLDRGADVNGRDASGATPLMLAMGKGRADICQLLLERGADPRLTDLAGRTVLGYLPRDGDDALTSVVSPPPSPAMEENTSTAEQPVAPPGEGNDAWEAEEEAAPPADDAELRARASAVQQAAAAHRATTADQEWTDVEIELPLLLSPKLSDPRRLRERERLRTLFASILATGLYSLPEVTACFELTPDPAGRDGDERRLEAALCTAAALGTLPESWEDWAGAAVDRRRAKSADVEEALLFYDQQWTADEALDCYYRDVASKAAPSRELEQMLWRRHESARFGLWGRALTAIPSIDELVELLEREQASESPVLLPISQGDGSGDDHRVAVATAIAELTQLRSSGDETLRSSLASRLNTLRVPLRIAENLVENVRSDDGEVDGAQQALRDVRRTRDRILETNLKLVIWIARKYGWSSLSLEDRIQEGNLGLMKAVDRYDPARGTRFITYAVWWVRQAISRAIQDYGRTIRIPVHVAENERRVVRTMSELSDQIGREPTAEEIAEKTGVAMTTVERIIKGLPATESLDARLEGDRQDFILSIPEPGQDPQGCVVEADMRAHITRALSSLNPREERVLRMRFGIGLDSDMTLEEVGTTFEVTRERVRQIEHKALVRLAHPARSRKLRSLVEG